MLAPGAASHRPQHTSPLDRIRRRQAAGALLVGICAGVAKVSACAESVIQPDGKPADERLSDAPIAVLENRRYQGAGNRVWDHRDAYAVLLVAGPMGSGGGALGFGRKRSRGWAGPDDPDRGEAITSAGGVARVLAVETDHAAGGAGTIGP